MFLSEAIEVPDEDVLAGKVTVTRYDTGEPFDWRHVTGDVLRIRTASSIPQRAAVAVRYRSRWFDIDDADPMS